MVKELMRSDLSSILHSKRANLYYLEYCRVLVKGGRVEYVTEAGKQSLYWNIPIANTTSILLGTGTSITQAAVRELAKAGVLIGFCGGGGTPLFSAIESDVDVAWMAPQSEYRPTKYLQQWVSFWFDAEKRLAAAKRIQELRLNFLMKHWLSERRARAEDFKVHPGELQSAVEASKIKIRAAANVMELLTEEARLTKHLYRLAVMASGYGEFRRVKGGKGVDPANRFLDHGNYLAYGLGATATWVLGLPHGLAVLHGKTRRGGLVFDVADLIKDALVLPQAFISAVRGDEEQTFRGACIESFTQVEALDFMIDALKNIAEELGQ